MAELTVQRVVFPTERRLRPLYYRTDDVGGGESPEPEFPDRFSVRLSRGTVLTADCYFNAFYECYWRRYTRLGRLRLRLLAGGAGTARLWRRSLPAGTEVLAVAHFDFGNAEGAVELDVPDLRVHARELGALHFDVTARSAQVSVRDGAWVSPDAYPAPVRLVAGYCTFNRERFLLANVAALTADPAVVRALERIVVVDQGTSRVRNHPGLTALPAASRDKLRLVEQGNFGGAGGFTRAMLEARGEPGATHVLLMDDDAAVEPESVFRAAAFLSLATGDLAVGGPMLDMLRPLDIYESGAWVRPDDLGILSPISRAAADDPDTVDRFLEVERVHYSGWWFFAVPLRLVERVGLPLPLFIRGDDVEYGCRLLRAGVETAVVPGLGVWHEPFYLKSGGWQPYYDLRNMLVLTALRFAPTRRGVAKAFLRRLIGRLLTCDYDQAGLLCRAVEDFCRGPVLLAGDPREVHREVLAARAASPQESLALAGPPQAWQDSEPPATRLGRALLLARCLARHALRRSPRPDAAPGTAVREQDAGWWSLGRADVAAVEDWYGDRLRVVRRSRGQFLRLLGRGLRAALRLYRGHPALAAEWRAASGRMTTEAFWREYLGLAVAGAGAEGIRRAA